MTTTRETTHEASNSQSRHTFDSCALDHAARTSGHVCVSDVARLADEGLLVLSDHELAERRGPFPLYLDNCRTCGIDDFRLEASGTVLVPAFGQIFDSTGCVACKLELGRCSVNEHVYALVPYDSADARYLWRVLSVSPKLASMVSGTSQLHQLQSSALLSTQIPWPEQDLRDAFCDRLDAYEAEISSLVQTIPALLKQGDEEFAQLILACEPSGPDTSASEGNTVPLASLVHWSAGTTVAPGLRSPEKTVRFEGTYGELGRCDEALSQGPAIVVGPSGDHLLAHWVNQSVHPTDGTWFADQGACTIDLAFLFFALRAAGIYERNRLGEDRSAGAQVAHLSLRDLDMLSVHIGQTEARTRCTQHVRDLLERITAAEVHRTQVADERLCLIRDFVYGNSFEGQMFGQAPLPRARNMSASFSQTPDLQTSDLQTPNPHRPESRASQAGYVSYAAAKVAPERLEALGSLAPLAEKLLVSLEAADAAWELAPLIAKRCGASVHLNLYETGSKLPPVVRGVLERELDQLPPEAFTRNSAAAALALDPHLAVLPASVRTIIARALQVACEKAGSKKPSEPASVYIPWEGSLGLSDIVRQTFPASSLSIQFSDELHARAAALLHAIEKTEGTTADLTSACGNALVKDAFPDLTAQLVAAVLPANPGTWSKKAPEPDDPRWASLGVPTRARANYAWIQQALAHQAEAGATVLLIANAALHCASGVECRLRKALAASGRVHAVMSLPAHALPGRRPPSSLLILGDADSCDEILMLNCLGFERNDDSGDIERALHILEEWFRGGTQVRKSCFAAVAARSTVIETGGLLTPWSYTDR